MQFRPAPILSALAVVGSLVLAPSVAVACGGFFCSQVPIDQTGENIVFVDHGGTIETHVQVSFAGEAEDFAWVVPVPGIPELDLGTEELFRTLLWSTRPTFTMTVGEHDCANPYVYEGWDDDLDSDGGGPWTGDSAGDGAGEVEILQQTEVGSYEATVVGATDAQALVDWFNCNDYRVAYSSLPRIENYLAEGMDFLALKLKSGATTGDLMPLVMTYASERPMIPLVLTAVATEPNLLVRAWFVSESRAVPVNYDHVWVNDARIQWQSGWWYGGTTDYDRLVARAIDEAGGHAFATDYSADGSFLYGLLYPANGYDLDSLRVLTDPAAFLVRALQIGLPRNGVMQGLIRTHIPMPKELVDAGITEQQFYNGISNYSAYLVDLDFDPAAFVADIEERITGPMEHANELFASGSPNHLTRMTSRLSGWEMDEDPVFMFLPEEVPEAEPGTYPWLGDVAQDRSAPLNFVGGDAETQCYGVAAVVDTQVGVSPVMAFPWQEGIDFPEAGDLKSCLDLPAAMVVERFSFDGPAEVILDRRGTLAEAGKYCVWGMEPELSTAPPPNVEWPPDETLMPEEAVDPLLCDQFSVEDAGFDLGSDPDGPGEVAPAPGGLFGDVPSCSYADGDARLTAAALFLLVPGLALVRRRSRMGVLVLAAGALVVIAGCNTEAPEETPRMAFAKVTSFEGVPAPEAADALLAAMERLDIDRAVLVPHGLSPAVGTEAGLELAYSHVGQFGVLGSTNPGDLAAAEILRDSTNRGAVGAKLNLSGGRLAGLDTAELEEIVQGCAEAGMPLVLEVDLGPATRQLELERLLRAWPEERIVVAHWGGLIRQADRLDGLLNRHPNLYVDTSVGGDGSRLFAAASANPVVFSALLERHADRFVWGTGATLSDAQAVAEWEARVLREFALYRDDLALTESTLQKVFRDNGLGLFGGTP